MLYRITFVCNFGACSFSFSKLSYRTTSLQIVILDCFVCKLLCRVSLQIVMLYQSFKVIIHFHFFYILSRRATFLQINNVTSLLGPSCTGPQLTFKIKIKIKYSYTLKSSHTIAVAHHQKMGTATFTYV